MMMNLTAREQLGKRVKRNGKVYVYSDVLALMFEADTNDPRSKRLEMLISSMEYMHVNRGSKVRKWP
jgi:hypothetical protein